MEELEEIKQEFIEKLNKAFNEKSLFEIEVGFLGRKGKLTQVLRGLSAMTMIEKKQIGALANDLKIWMEEQLKNQKSKTKSKEWEKIAETERLDINTPIVNEQLPITALRGHLHPLSNFILKVMRVFQELGFEIVESHEIETDWYNFGALNIPEDHPVRDTQDTFYVKDLADPDRKDLLLATQTSAMQVRYMENNKPPIKIIVPGKCYRRDDDATHFPMFHQFEGLVVDKDINLGHLKWTLQEAMKKLLGEDTRIRFRTSYFPFVEPGLEVDVTCTICKGKGCSVCKKTGWLELLGAGMVHPQVLRNGGIDPEIYSGFAFGMGIERLCMMKHEIPNIKYLFDNDLRFLEQF